MRSGLSFGDTVVMYTNYSFCLLCLFCNKIILLLYNKSLIVNCDLKSEETQKG